MKHLLFFLLFTVGISAQIKQDANGGYYWSDSLWNAIYVDTVGVDDTTAASTTSELSLNFQYDWMHITAIDTGATYDDSVVVEYGTKIYIPDTNRIGNANIVSDTLWQKVNFMRDSSWTNVNIMVNDNAYTTYAVYVGNYDLIRVRMVNATAVENRIWKFYAILSRKR